MQSDPTREWQRLTRLYGEMSDEEVIELAAGFGDLTELAQPILRDEMKRRALGDPQEQKAASPQTSPAPGRVGFASEGGSILGGWSNTVTEENGDSSDEAEQDEENAPHEYTWKMQLCECGTREEASQIFEVLRRAGIEAWPSGPSSAFGTQTTRIMVAADQLEQANAILAQPIPQDVIDQSKVKVEDFVPPTCPKCGAEDPLLESVEPTNSWRCENCGAQWTDSSAFDPGSCTTS
jgi:hypothetical protein